MEKLRVLDLFSGIGGFSLGLERTGHFETVAFCEIDEDARKVLHKHWPGVHKFKDIRDMRPKCGDYDVICGGFPCQDISTLNKKGEGLNGQRSGLWTEFYRLIKEIKPKYVIGENVTALRGKGLTQILKDLWSLGYDAEGHCIPASAFNLPTPRDRIWVIAYPQGERAGLDEPRLRGYLERADLQATIDTNTEVSRERLLDISKRFGCEPTVQRGNDGLSKRLDRIRGRQIGNAVTPLIPELIGRAIAEHELFSK